MRQDKTRQNNTTQARQQTEHITTPRQHHTPCGVCLKLSIRELKRQYKKTIQHRRFFFRNRFLPSILYCLFNSLIDDFIIFATQKDACDWLKRPNKNTNVKLQPFKITAMQNYSHTKKRITFPFLGFLRL